MSCKRAFWLLAFVAIMPALATSDLPAQSVAGSYALIEIGGKPLPATVEIEDDCREDIVSATLTLNDDGTWKLESLERDVCPGKAGEDENESETGRYRVTGGTAEFLDDDGKSQREKEGEDLDDLSAATIAANIIRVKLGATETIAVFRKN